MSESDVNLVTVLNDSQSDWAILDRVFLRLSVLKSDYAGQTIYLLLRAHESTFYNTFYCNIFQCREITFSSHLIQTASLKLNQSIWCYRFSTAGNTVRVKVGSHCQNLQQAKKQFQSFFNNVAKHRLYWSRF